MIVVDTSVWIGNLRGLDRDPVKKLKALETPNDILLGDIIVLEILQGARDDLQAARIERALRQFQIAAMLDDTRAVRVAQNVRMLRRRGITIRKTIDAIIATFCIEGRHLLLHDDRDFLPFEQHLGLRTL